MEWWLFVEILGEYTAPGREKVQRARRQVVIPDPSDQVTVHSGRVIGWKVVTANAFPAILSVWTEVEPGQFT